MNPPLATEDDRQALIEGRVRAEGAGTAPDCERAWRIFRDYAIAADTMGINTARYKTVTFGISAAYTGIAGALSASAIAFVAPDSFSVFLSITLFRPFEAGWHGMAMMAMLPIAAPPTNSIKLKLRLSKNAKPIFAETK